MTEPSSPAAEPDPSPISAPPSSVEASPTWPSQAPTGGAPVGAALPGSPATSSNGIVALVLAISSWVILPFVLGWIFAIIGLVFAGRGSREIAESAGRIGGQGFVTAARIVAWINIGLTAALAVLALVVLGIVIAAGAMSEGLG